MTIYNLQTNLFDSKQIGSVNKIKPSTFFELSVKSETEYELYLKTTNINYQFIKTPFKNTFVIAFTKQHEIIYAAFNNNENEAVIELETKFPTTRINKLIDAPFINLDFLQKNNNLPITRIKLLIKGTEFKIKVWAELLNIPFGETVRYSDIANLIHNKKYSRAVGLALGSNPIAFLIPCHRVINKNKIIGNYLWGTELKKEILLWEKQV